MKFSKFGHVSLVSAIALILAGTFTACNPVTIDYIFVAGDKPATGQSDGQIQTFLADRVSGALNPIGSLVSSGGVTPVSEATSVDYKHLYVANQGDSTIVQLDISGSGTLTAAKTVNLGAEGNTPVEIFMNTAGTLLYVVNTYRPGCSVSEPCGGALAVFPVGTDGSLGSAVSNGGLSYWPVGVHPTAVTALPSGTAVYVTSYDPTAGLGYINGFSATSGGTLTALPALVSAGVKPVAVASVPTSRFIYVTDFSQNEMIAYGVLDKASLQPLINGPFKTGNQPTSIEVDPRGAFIYVTNALDNTVSAYQIDLPTGTPSATINSLGSGVNTTGTQPVAVLIDPSYGRFVYTANILDNSLSAFVLNSTTGSLTAVPNGPFPSIGQPAALAAIPRGNHAIQINQP